MNIINSIDNTKYPSVELIKLSNKTTSLEQHLFFVEFHRYYAGVGLTCLVLIPVVLMAVGLLCGIFGHDKHASPTERGGISHMGGNCLMA